MPEVDRQPSSPRSSRADHWMRRLVLDESVSTTSPTIRGTWVTVGEVVSLVVDGWPWGEILRAYPELDEDDLRACLDYTLDEAADPGVLA